MIGGCAGTWGASTGEGHQSSILPSWEGSGRGPWVGTAGPGRQRLLSGRVWVSIINTGAIPISGRGGHGPKAGVTTVPPGTDTTPKSRTWAQPTGWPLSHQCLTAQRSKSWGIIVVIQARE